MNRQFAFSIPRSCRSFATALFAVCALLPSTIQLCASDATGQGSAEEPLETVYVSAENGLAYSGPSEEFYPTGQMEIGTALEIHHRTPDGWLGVRPPQGSFSWVPAADAYLLPGGRVIEITNANAVSWIGTQLGSAKQYRWQVQLRSGEQLAVIGEAKIQDADGEEMLWYRITPPAGEFRWIPESSTSKSPVEKKPKTKRTPSGSEPASGPTPAADALVTTAAYARPIAQDDVFDDSLPAPRGPQSIRENAGGEYIEGQVIDGEYIDGEYIDGEYIEGEYIDGEYIDGEYIDGEYIDGEYIDGDYYGEPYYEDEYAGEYYEEVPHRIGAPLATSHRHDPFAGWHIMELCDDGFRFPFLERIFAANAANKVSDPLKYDPYNLQTASRSTSVTRPIPTRSFVAHEEYVVDESPRRHRPWRDPRELHEQRLRGNVGRYTARAWDNRASLGGDNSDTPSALQQRVESLRAALSDTFGANTAVPSTGQRRFHDDFSGGSPGAVQPVPNLGQVDWYGVGQSRDTGNQALEFNNQVLSQLQIELSRIVAQPSEYWNLVPLATETKRYIEQGTSAVERGQARLLLERIEEFQAVAARTELAMRGGNAIGASFNSPTSSSVAPVTTAGYQTSVSQAPDALSGEPAFDATGWLVPVYGAVAGQPSYALTNDAGSVIAYVSALPGMKLDHHLNQPVGIRGLKGYLPQLQAGHIQAQYVSRLR